MSPQTTSVLAAPKPTTEDDRPAHDELVTWRIEIARTDRLLRLGFHIGPAFMRRETEQQMPYNHDVAEFGDEEIATRVLEKLHHTAPLIVCRVHWGRLEGVKLNKLCERVAATGAHVNMLFWSPAARAARALMDMPTGRRLGPK